MNKQELLDRIQELTQPLSPIGIDHQTKLRKLDNIKCVAFDFYGTMFISDVGDIGIDESAQTDSVAIFSESLRQTRFELTGKNAAERGKELFEETIDSLLTAAHNDGIDHPEPDIRAVWWDVLTNLLEENQISGELSRETAEEFGVEFEFRINDIWPVPGLRELLNSLKEKGLELGVISNSQFYTPLAFEAFFDYSPEEFGFNPNLLVWSFKTGYKKPSRHFYNFFIDGADKENLDPAEVLYVGNDIRKDIQPASELGLKTALYVGDRRSIRHEEEELEKKVFKPDLVIDDLRQILDCLQL